MSTIAYQKLLSTLNELDYDKNTKISSPHPLSNSFGLQWRNQKAIQRVYETIARTGKQPDAVVTKEGGFVVWMDLPSYTLPNHTYWKFEIHDIALNHSKPGPGLHPDFMFLWKDEVINADKAKQLIDISDSIMYYQVGHKLVGVCHFYSASLATFAAVKMFNLGYVDISQASNVYDTTIKDLIMEYEAAQNSGYFGSYPMPKHRAYEEFIFHDSTPKVVFPIKVESLGQSVDLGQMVMGSSGKSVDLGQMVMGSSGQSSGKSVYLGQMVMGSSGKSVDLGQMIVGSYGQSFSRPTQIGTQNVFNSPTQLGTPSQIGRFSVTRLTPSPNKGPSRFRRTLIRSPI